MLPEDTRQSSLMPSSLMPHAQFAVLSCLPPPLEHVGYFRQSLLVAVQYRPVVDELSHVFDPHAQLDGLMSKPLVCSHVGIGKCSHTFKAALQYMLEEAQRLGAPTVPHAQGAALIVTPFSWPQAQHFGTSMAFTHWSLSHMKCGAWATRLLLPLLAQKLSTTPRSAMELQGVQMSEVAEGIPEGLEVAVLSTQAWPQRVEGS